MSIFIQVEQAVSDYNVLWTAFRSNAQAALRDFVAVKEKLRTLFGEATQQLKTLRGDTLGNGALDDELARRHLDGEQRAFDLLGKTGRPGGRS